MCSVMSNSQRFPLKKDLILLNSQKKRNNLLISLNHTVLQLEILLFSLQESKNNIEFRPNF